MCVFYHKHIHARACGEVRWMKGKKGSHIHLLLENHAEQKLPLCSLSDAVEGVPCGLKWDGQDGYMHNYLDRDF